jgi:hypothetical protein
MDESELDQTIDDLSRKVVALARAAVESGASAAGAARALNDRLTELWPQAAIGGGRLASAAARAPRRSCTRGRIVTWSA